MKGGNGFGGGDVRDDLVGGKGEAIVTEGEDVAEAVAAELLDFEAVLVGDLDAFPELVWFVIHEVGVGGRLACGDSDGQGIGAVGGVAWEADVAEVEGNGDGVDGRVGFDHDGGDDAPGACSVYQHT